MSKLEKMMLALELTKLTVVKAENEQAKDRIDILLTFKRSCAAVKEMFDQDLSQLG